MFRDANLRDEIHTVHPTSAEAELTAIELTVIDLSRRDSVASLAPRRLFGRLFGVRHPQQLSSPRLEALRRYAILYRLRGDTLASVEHERLIDAGYGFEIETIRRAVRRLSGTLPATR